MATRRLLHVALQDGFEDEPVLVRLDGEEVYREDEVSTDHRIGLAASFEHAVTGDTALVEVTLPRRELSDRLRVDAASTPYVGISIINGAIRWRPSADPFGYA